MAAVCWGAEVVGPSGVSYAVGDEPARIVTADLAGPVELLERGLPLPVLQVGDAQIIGGISAKAL